MRLAVERCTVVVSDINEAGASETAARIQNAGHRAAVRNADISQQSEARALVDFAVSEFGGLDILVNDASAPYLPGDPMDHWFEAIHVDLLGTMYATQCAIPEMRKRGGGAILTVGSTWAVGHGYEHCPMPAYDVAKAAVMRLATTLGWLGAEGIRVNCLVPDWVATPDVRAYWEPLTPEQRAAAGAPAVLTSLDEIGDAVVRLVSDESLFGRVLVWWSGLQPGLIPDGDYGYEALVPW